MAIGSAPSSVASSIGASLFRKVAIDGRWMLRAVLRRTNPPTSPFVGLLTS
jgi:hypothetical protein